MMSKGQLKGILRHNVKFFRELKKSHVVVCTSCGRWLGWDEYVKHVNGGDPECTRYSNVVSKEGEQNHD